jgi:hypothetical protein
MLAFRGNSTATTRTRYNTMLQQAGVLYPVPAGSWVAWPSPTAFTACGYESGSRVLTVSDGVNSVTYICLANSPLAEHIVLRATERDAASMNASQHGTSLEGGGCGDT